MKINIFKFMLVGLLIACATFYSCSSDDELTAPRLFRPLAKLTATNNNITVKWDLIKDASSYEVAMSKDSFKTTLSTVSTTLNSYTFENVEWDETYQVKIKALSTTTGNSEIYDCDEISVTYPTVLNKITEVIDVAAKVSWKVPAEYSAFEILKKNDNNDEYSPVDTISISSEELTNLTKTVYNLNASTSYRIIAFSGSADNYQYQGRQDFKTAAAENYGSNMVDLRSLSDSEASSYITSAFLASLQDGCTVVLKGGCTYTILGNTEITKGVKFVTGQTLAGNATFLVNGFIFNASDISDISFKKLDLLTAGDKTTANFGGKYIFNANLKSNVNSLSFEDCNIKYMRGIIRLQSQPSIIKSLTINKCIMDSIGGYGIANTDIEDSQFNNVVISNSTISHAEKTLVNTKSKNGFGSVTINDCTFAYCSKTTNKLFDFGTKTTLNVGLQFQATNCLFGTSFTGAATNGISCSGTDSSIRFTNCFKTADLTWILDATGTFAAYPLPADVMNYSNNTTDLWVNPAAGDFSFKDSSFAGISTTGDPRWR